MIFLYTDAEEQISDTQIQWLVDHSSSDDIYSIRNLWESTWKARQESFAVNKKLKKRDHYLFFRCLESPEGSSLVKNFLIMNLNIFFLFKNKKVILFAS